MPALEQMKQVIASALSLPVTDEETESMDQNTKQPGVKLSMTLGSIQLRSVASYWQYYNFQASTYIANQRDDTLIQTRGNQLLDAIVPYAIKSTVNIVYDSDGDRKIVTVTWTSRGPYADD